MSVTARQRQVLQQLGVTVWLQRGRQEEPKPTAAPAPSGADAGAAPKAAVEDRHAACTALQECASPLATVLVEWPAGDLSLEQGHPAGELLLRMLQALEQPLDRYLILGCERASAVAPAALPAAPVFCLADDPSLTGAGWIQLPSLQRMLEEGKPAKAEAWAAMKPWVRRLAGTRQA